MMLFESIGETSDNLPKSILATAIRLLPVLSDITALSVNPSNFETLSISEFVFYERTLDERGTEPGYGFIFFT